MRRVKRYPLLRQQAFNEETEDDRADSKPGVNSSFREYFMFVTLRSCRRTDEIFLSRLLNA